MITPLYFTLKVKSPSARIFSSVSACKILFCIFPTPTPYHFSNGPSPSASCRLGPDLIRGQSTTFALEQGTLLS